MKNTVEYEVAVIPCGLTGLNKEAYSLRVRWSTAESFLFWERTAWSKWHTVYDSNNTTDFWSLEEASRRADWIERNGIVPSTGYSGRVHAIADRFTADASD